MPMIMATITDVGDARATELGPVHQVALRQKLPVLLLTAVRAKRDQNNGRKHHPVGTGVISRKRTLFLRAVTPGLEPMMLKWIQYQ